MELIKITERGGRKVVSARELYDHLGLKKAHFARWSIMNIIDDEFFVKGVDYEALTMMVNGRHFDDYAISIDMAKHLAMLSRTEKGKELRQYFIEVEKVATSKPTDIRQLARELLKELDDKDLEITKINKEKSWIGSKREATAMATASRLSKENKKLKENEDLEHFSIKYMEQKHGRKFRWQILKPIAIREGHKIPKIPDGNYKEGVNGYHIDTWKLAYSVEP